MSIDLEVFDLDMGDTGAELQPQQNQVVGHSTVRLNRGLFSKFLNTINIISPYCNDADILNGKIRQRTNTRDMIFEIDMTQLIGSITIPLNDIRSKNTLLRCFELDDSVTLTDDEIVLSIEPTNYKFQDPISYIQFTKAITQYMDNTYQDDEEFSKVIQFCREDNILLSTTIPKYVCKRIKAVCEGFQNQSIKIEMNNTTGMLVAANTNQVNTSKLFDNIQLLKNFEIPSSIVFNPVPFYLETSSDIDLKFYFRSENVLIGKFSMAYGDVPVCIYILVQITR